MFYFMNGRRPNNCCKGEFPCGRPDREPGPGPSCPPPKPPHPERPCPPPEPPHPERPCPPPKPPCPPPHPPKDEGKKCGEDGHGKKDGPGEEKKHGHKRDCPEHDKDRKNEIACRERNSCCCNSSGGNHCGCPDLLRWALWSSGFFRCNRCEQSGWRHKRGGGGFC